MDEYKIVYKGFEAIVLPYEEVVNNLVSRLNTTESNAGRLIKGPNKTLKVVHQEQDALKFQRLFHQLGLSTYIVKPMALVPSSENELDDENTQSSTVQQSVESPVVIQTVSKRNIVKGLKKFILSSSFFRLSNIVLFLGVLLVAIYFPFIDGVVRYGFAVGVVFLASSLSLKSVDR